MKKIYLFTLALAGSFSLSAQFQNASFEFWTTGEPNGWITQNAAYAALGGALSATPVTQVSGGASAGNEYARCTTFELTGATDPLNNGIYGARVAQQFNSDVRYPSFSLDVKHDGLGTGMGTDRAYIGILGLNGSTIIARGEMTFEGDLATWEEAEISVTYFNVVNTTPVSQWTIDINSSYKSSFILAGVSDNRRLIAPQLDAQLDVDNVVFTEPINVTNVVASDIGNDGDGRDLLVSFDVPADESEVQAYHVLVTNATVNASFLATPLAAATNWGAELTPNGSAQTHTFGQTDEYVIVGTGVETIEENVDLRVTVIVEGTDGSIRGYAFSDLINLENTASTTELTYDEVKLFPNPANDVVNIDFGGRLVSNVSIFSVTGQKVMDVNTTAQDVKLDVSGLNEGIYVYRLTNAAGEILSHDKFSVNR